MEFISDYQFNDLCRLFSPFYILLFKRIVFHGVLQIPAIHFEFFDQIDCSSKSLPLSVGFHFLSVKCDLKSQTYGLGGGGCIPSKFWTTKIFWVNKRKLGKFHLTSFMSSYDGIISKNIFTSNLGLC